jgi:hypothetical protein
MLLLIRDSRAITLKQLYEEVSLRRYETRTNSAYWRLRRLQTTGFIDVINDAGPCGEHVYTITHRGLGLLESKGHSLLSLGSFSRTIIRQAEILHMTELNSIRIALLRSGTLVSWKSEMQIVSENLALFGEVSKDYDAEVSVKTRTGIACFALEIERTAKAAVRYQEIKGMIDADSRTKFVLYLSTTQELLFLLLQELRGADKQIAFGLSIDFQRELLEMPVLVTDDRRVVRRKLCDLLFNSAPISFGNSQDNDTVPAI